MSENDNSVSKNSNSMIAELIKFHWKPVIIIALASSYCLYDPSESTSRATFCTLLAVIWYTWETHELRAQSVHVAELQNRPLITLQVIPAQANTNDVALQNIGNGAGLNVCMTVLKQKEGNAETMFSGPLVECIIRNETVKFDDIANRNVQDKNYRKAAIKGAEACLDPAMFKESYTVDFEYSDITGIKYRTRYRTNNFGVEFLVSERISP